MRIGIDATWAGATGTGTATFARGLISALIERSEHEYVLYFQSEDRGRNPLYALSAPNASRRVVDGAGQIGRSWAALSAASRSDRLDVFYSPTYFGPLRLRGSVVTFYDANMFLQWRKWWRPGMRIGWLSLCLQTLVSSRASASITTVSRYSANEICRLMRIPRARVHVIYPGIDDQFFQSEPIAGAVSPFDRPYVLSVGVQSPQKNLEGVVRSFARLDRKDLLLVIVGRRDGPYFDERLVPLAHHLGLHAQMRYEGVVSRERLGMLYRHADAFLFPSFAEGFGLPPLEAMASGTPVVASNRTSLPEVLGNAALLVDPDDTAALAEGLDSVLSDPSLAARLRRLGHQQASRFRWSTAADDMLQVYKAVA